MEMVTEMTINKFQSIVLGKEIDVIAVDTGAGVNISISGGDKGHIGAVAVKYLTSVSDS